MTETKTVTNDWFHEPLGMEPDEPFSVGGLMCKIAALERQEHLAELAAVGRMLDLRRREQGLSTDELVRLSHVTAQGFLNLERGLRMPNSADVIRQVSRVLDLPSEKLVEAAGVNGASDPVLSTAAVRCAERAKSPIHLWPAEQEALTEFIGVLSGK